MPFVVDASVAAAWLLADEESRTAEEALSFLETEDALVPDLFWHEMRNILLTAERRKRISNEDVLACLMRLTSLPLRTVSSEDHLPILRLAGKYQLSAYDAAYLALAVAENISLATLDARLERAASAESLTFGLS
ncbi:type II toxin-antitoxin system VapC family toxin [Rhizobium leguminosarum]|jgi:predicted nucleic acid-binding protein|uniref:type II toxin-antitoxin system VapC family toxin n=1 Tax=Rhizobium leguminosarum TaxID=384 RepID=UPI001A939BD8|nr:type II toxin-antitoxin system VapC family toxin [Rhizobium leguminosarum]MBY3175743.1 type II toxin-antitoxin system VapC family toxin [Rhizobium leguminosarum]MBY5545445.1 type II toxin-antitoxin system VapC family toxin [Rhizobium leguminosarum]MBY5552896.1 type II toxin-antitoxin system VapC family toxin [Rhizobium leguminosarum]MBY5625983.1 type II toxin-antitoxin system VapC family toxin [Rhizobium leguminosarum]MBY5634644.1 type II toxin-antitoxin system VapC family toxin [Rhizobium 